MEIFIVRIYPCEHAWNKLIIIIIIIIIIKAIIIITIIILIIIISGGPEIPGWHPVSGWHW